METTVLLKEQLGDIAANVLESFLGFPLDQDAGFFCPSDGYGARLTITGAWHGEVLVVCSPVLARRIAHRMFKLPLDQIDDERMRDALDEIGNIIAGNIKALLPAPSKLSIPEFFSDFSHNFSGACETSVTTQDGDALYLAVHVLEDEVAE